MKDCGLHQAGKVHHSQLKALNLQILENRSL